LNTKAKRKKKTAKLPPTTLLLIIPTKTQEYLSISSHPERVREKYFFKVYCYLGWFSISLASLGNLNLLNDWWHEQCGNGRLATVLLCKAYFLQCLVWVLGFYFVKTGLP